MSKGIRLLAAAVALSLPGGGKELHNSDRWRARPLSQPAALTGAGSGLPASTSGRVLNVVLIDTGAVREAEMEWAQREAARLLVSAGVTVRWVSPNPDAPPPDGALVLRILSAEMARRWPATKDACGSAVGRIANVFYHCLDKLTEGHADDKDRARLLGSLMAHELGHLLLGPGIHSASGLMKANWGAKDLEMVQKGILLFLPGDRDRIATSEQ